MQFSLSTLFVLSLGLFQVQAAAVQSRDLNALISCLEQSSCGIDALQCLLDQSTCGDDLLDCFNACASTISLDGLTRSGN